MKSFTKMFTDKRQKNRFLLNLIVEFRPYQRSSDFTLGIMRNISEEGFSFEAEISGLSKGDMIEFRLKHPKSEAFASGLGTVIWTEGESYDSHIGIQFHELSAADKDTLTKLYSIDREGHAGQFQIMGSSEEGMTPEISTTVSSGAVSPANEASSVSKRPQTIVFTPKARQKNKVSFKPLAVTFAVILTVLLLIFSRDILKKTFPDPSDAITLNKPAKNNPLILTEKLNIGELPLLNVPESTISSQHNYLKSSVSVIEGKKKEADGDSAALPEKSPPASFVEKNVDRTILKENNRNIQVKEEQPAPAAPRQMVASAVPVKSTLPVPDIVTSPKETQNIQVLKRTVKPTETPQIIQKEIIKITDQTNPPQPVDLSNRADLSLAEKEIKNSPVSYSQIHVYEESFSENSNGWDEFETSIVSASVTGGQYHIRNKVNMGTYVILHHHDFPGNDDFDIEVYIQPDTISNSGYYGFVFGASDPINCYSFQINNKGDFSIKKYTKAMADELAKGIIEKVALRNNAASILKVSKVQANFLFSVNNQLVAELSDLPFHGNKFGFVLEGQSGIAVDKTISTVKIRE